MAINRFSPIQGLPEWQPAIPLDILVKGLTYKQELFDKNKALLESNVAIGKNVADRILNDEAKKYTQDKINSYKGYLNNNLAYADLTDDAVMKTADTRLLDVTNDMNIVNWVSKSGATSKELNRIDDLKKKGDARYDQLHENSFLLDVNAMKTAKMDEGLNMPTPAYTDFYDADKEKQQLIKDFKPNHIKYTKKLPGGYLMDIEDQSVYQEQLQAYLEANLSDKAKRELAFRGEYEYKGGFLYEKDDTRKSNYLNNITKQYIGAIDASIKASNTHILGLEQQKFKLDPKDKDFDRLNKEIDNEIQKYKTVISNQEANKATFLASPDKYVKDISQNLYVNKYVSNAAKGNVRVDKSETLRNDENYWNGLNYVQKLKEFEYQKKKDYLDRELEAAKIGAKLDKDGRLMQADPFGTGQPGSPGPNLVYSGPETVDPSKGPVEFINAVEQKAVIAKEQIYNQYYRVWEKEAAGPNGFFTPEQKTNWNALDAKGKKDYFMETVLPTYYKRMENNSTTMTLPNGQKVTRDASYVPNWFKQMRNDPAYRASYLALGVANGVHEKLAENFKGVDVKSANGKTLTPIEIAEMVKLQTEIEENFNMNDAYSLQNLYTNIKNYEESEGANTGSGFIDWMRTIMPGSNYTVSELQELAKKFGGIKKLKSTVENLLYNTDNGTQLTAFGTNTLQYSGVGAGIGSTPAGVGAVPGLIVGAAYGLSKDFADLFSSSGSEIDFDDIGDNAREAIQSTIDKMTVNQNYYRVGNKELEYYKKVQNPMAIEIANGALRQSVTGFSLTSDFAFEGVTDGGEFMFSYNKGGLDADALAKTKEALDAITESSMGVVTYDRTGNNIKVKVDPSTLGIFREQTELFNSRALFENGLISSLPKNDYYAKDPKTGTTKVYTYQFGRGQNGQTELYFYRDGKKITVPYISSAEATIAGTPATDEFLSTDPAGADLLFTRALEASDKSTPGSVQIALDNLLNYSENN